MKRTHVFLMIIICMSFAQLVQATSTPGISRIYGDYFIPEVAQYQSQGSVGTLDTTFQTGGSVSLSAQLASSQAKATQILSDGSVLVVLDNGTNSTVVKYTATGALYTTTGGTFGTSSACALTGLTSVTGMMIDCYGRILVFGNNNGSSKGWLRRITSAGVLDGTFSFTDTNWTAIGAISEQQSEDIIIVGRNASSTPVVARILPAGSIDTTFGTSGYTTFNGNATDQYSVVVTSTNTIFISYKDATSGYASIAKYTAAGALETAYNSTGIKTSSLGATLAPVAGQLRLALDASGNVVIAGYYSNAIYVASYPQADSGTITAVLSPFSVAISAHALQLSALITTSDGNIMLLGSDTTSILMTVFSITSAGVLDTKFNTTGYLQFSISSPGTSSILLAGAIAPDGELFAAGYQVNSGTTTPYLSAIYNEIYVTQVAQYPITTQQGNIDLSFGSGQTIGGVVRTFNGVYGSNLEQTANYVIELASAQLLVGMSGFLNTSASSNMSLSLLSSTGTLVANYSLTQHSANEYLTGIIQNADTTLYVCGYASSTPGGAATGVIIRKYNSSGVEQWQTTTSGAGYKALGMLTQGSGRILVFMQTSATAGAIAAYNPSTGALDTTFNTSGSTAGMVQTTDFAGTPLANMGPIYGYALDPSNNICIAYKNSSTGYVDVAKINYNGTGLITAFGYTGSTPTGTGISPNVFNGITIANVQDLSMVRTVDGELQLNVAYSGGYLLAQLYIATGLVDTTYAPSGYFTIASVGTTTVITKTIPLSDKEMYLIGKSTTSSVDSMVILKTVYSLAQPAVTLDTTFNAQGSTPGILSFQVGNVAPSYTTRLATGAAVQAASGNIVLSAYEQSGSTESIPMAMHLYGASGETQVNQNNTTTLDLAGTINPLFGNNSGAEDLTSIIAAGTARVVYAYASGNVNQQFILVGVDTGTSTIIARVRENNFEFDTTFGTSGSGMVTLSGSVTGANYMTIDGQNNILIVGSTGGTTGWAHRLNNSGTTDTVFTMPTGFTSATDIGQQESGRYIISGIDTNSFGALVAFQDITSAGTLNVDTTFNPLGSVPGVYEIATTAGLYNLSINSDDTIFTAYSDTSSGHVNIAKVQANGIGSVTSFNSGSPIVTGITPTNASSIRCAFDTSQNIIVASSVGGNSVSVMRYTFNGAVDNTFNQHTGVGTILNITGLGSAGVIVSRLMIDQNNKIIVIGNNTAGGNGFLYATRLTNLGVLDTTWNSSPTSPDVAGILTYTIDNSTNAYFATMYIDGEILVAGLGTTNKPLIIAIVGDNYVTRVIQQPYQVNPGIIDTTLDTITPGSGALNLYSSLASLSLSSSTAQKIFIYPSGAILIAFNKGTSTILANLNAAQVLNTTGFNSGAIGSPAGSVTIPSAATITDLFVNNGTNGDNNIYMTGLNSGTLWTAQVTATGTVNSFTTTDTLSMSSVTRIRRSTNSRTLISGYAAGSIGRGVIAAYKSSESGLDLSFGGGLGYYATAVASTIADMQLDQYDRMYIAYVNAGTILIDRVESDGTTKQAWSAFGTSISVTTASQIRLALDQTNNQLVVAVQDGTSTSNNIRVRRYNLTTGANTCASELDISVSSHVLNLSELFIDNAQNIYVAGYDSTANNVVVAKINSTSSTTIAFDTTYGVAATGIADVSAGSNMTLVTSAALDPDRRVYVVGSQATPTPSMARLFGYPYTTELSTANTAGTPGVIDLTVDGSLDASPNGVVNLGTLPNWTGLSGYTARSLYTNSDGSAYILFSNTVSFQIGKITGDMNPVSGFGTNGLTSPQTLATPNAMTVDSQGRILVSGTTSGAAQAVFRYSTAGSLVTTFASTLTSLTVGGAVAEQQSGRILVAGLKGSSGSINAYQNTGLAQDTTYGPPANGGWYATGVNASIDGMVVDLYDNAYIVYRNTSNYVCLEKINDSGSYKVAAFNSGATVVISTIVATQKAQIAINSSGNIIVGATTSSGVKTAVYNGTTGAIIGSVQTITSANTPILTALTAAGTTFEGSIYTTQPMMLTFRIVGSTGLLDSTFGTSGIASYEIDSATSMNNLAVQPDGRIVVVGAASTPLLMRLYGTPYLLQQAQAPDAAPVGTLDITLNPTTGALDLTYLSVPNTSGGAVKRIYQYGNGIILLMFDNGTTTTLVRLQKDFTLDTTFNSTGYVAITGKTGATGLSVDAASGNIYATGGVTTSWTAAFSSTGTTLTGWTNPISNLTGGAYAVGVQTLNRIVVAGQNTNGTLIGYTNTGALDVTFGVNGYVTTGYAAPIVDISITALNQIIIVTNNSGAIVLQQVSADGSTITSLNSGTAITNVTNNGVRVIQDSSGNIIIGAATTTGFTLRRYTSTGTNNPTGAVTISTTGSSTSYIGNIYVTSDSKVVLAGYNLSNNNIVVSRLNSSFVLDTSFNSAGATQGVLLTTVGNMNLAYDATIDADDRTLVVGGSNISADPYMARVFGDAYVTAINQSQTIQLPGINDTTFGLTGSNGVLFFASPGAGTAQNQVARSVVMEGYDRIVVALDGQDTTNTQNRVFLNAFTGAGVLDTTFNTTGQVEIPHFYTNENVRNLIYFSQGGVNKAILAGYATSGTPLSATGSWLLQYNLDSVAADSTFGGLFQAPSGVAFGDVQQLFTVGRQSTGRVITSGLNYDNTGVVLGYTDTGILDTTFGKNGYFSPGTVGLYTHAVDTKNRVVIAYNNGSNVVALARILADGSGLDTTFNSTGTVTTGISGLSGNNQISVVVDASGNILVVAINNSGANYEIRRYNSAGTSYVDLVIAGAANLGSSTVVTLGQLIVDTDGKAIITGTATDSGGQWMLVVRTNTGITALDATFNAAGTPGYLKYKINSGNTMRQLTDAIIHPDGRIIVVGSESP